MGIEHVFIEYDPAKPMNRFELGTRKLVRTIELEHFKVEASASAPRWALAVPFGHGMQELLPRVLP